MKPFLFFYVNAAGTRTHFALFRTRLEAEDYERARSSEVVSAGAVSFIKRTAEDFAEQDRYWVVFTHRVTQFEVLTGICIHSTEDEAQGCTQHNFGGPGESTRIVTVVTLTQASQTPEVVSRGG